MKYLQRLILFVFCAILALGLLSCGQKQGTSSSTDPVTGVSFSFSKDGVSGTTQASRQLFKPVPTIDPSAKYGVVSIKDSSGNVVVSQKKLDIYELNNSYITGTILLGIGTYQVTEFFILDANDKVIYIVPTEVANDDLKRLVSKPLPISFSVAKDSTNSVSLQVLKPNTNTASDFGYPSIAFNIVKYIKLMLTVQILDPTNGWLLTTASLTANNVDYNIPAETATLLIAEAENYNLKFSKVGYGTTTITLSSNEIKSYETTPLVVVLSKGTTLPIAVLFDDFNGITTGKGFGALIYEDSLPNLGKAVNLNKGTYIKYSFPPWYNWDGIHVWNRNEAASGVLTEGTIEMWINPRQYSGILNFNWGDVASYPPAGHIMHLVFNADGKLIYGVWGGNGDKGPVGKTTIPLNKWTHLAVSWGPNGTKLYVNGKVDASTSVNVWPAFSGTVFAYLNYWGENGIGLVDALHIYNRALSDTEINSIYTSTGTTTIYSNGRFTVNSLTADCVTDTQTKLMWSKNANLWGAMTWQQALDKISWLNQNGGLCGYTDWILPSKEELKSLAYTGNIFTGLSTGHPFSNVTFVFLWSSTTNVNYPTAVWIVNIWDGYVGLYSQTNFSYFWPVRSGQ